MNGEIIDRVFALKERFLCFSIDTAIMALAYLFAIVLRFEFHAPHWGWNGVLITFFVVAAVQWLFLFLFGCHKAIWKYITVSDVPRFISAVACSATTLIILRFLMPGHFNVRPPYSITFINAIFVFGGLLLARVFSRMLAQSGTHSVKSDRPEKLRNVLLIGAGDAGNTVLREMRNQNQCNSHLIGFLDDDPAKQGANIQGGTVLGKIKDLPAVSARYNVDEVIVTMVCVPKEVIRRVVSLCKESDLPVRILPAFHELIDGSVMASRLRKVEISDLLGREETKFDDRQIIKVIANKCVLVTGAGGSIGSEIVRQTARMGPSRVVLFERFENALYQIDREIRQKMPDAVIVTVVGDVCDRARVEDVFRLYNPEVVIHAAAHKHVPMMEINAGEALKNNVIGTRVVGETAVKYNAERFILVSTDKAVNPLSVMGVTKRLAEMVVQSLNRRGKTIFSAVRFGNVLGSSGSVVPLFQEQIAQGGPVTVTHPEMTRYFMTIEEAVHLVLLSITQTEGGEIFILDMGEPVRIVDLAEEMIRLSGLKPYDDISIVFSGIRPGEKLYEDLDVSEASVLKTELARIYICKIDEAGPDLVDSMVTSCKEICRNQDGDSVKRHLTIDLYARLSNEIRVSDRENPGRIIKND
jgi:FlaA1/EpsC-like NDP-sugar epimerase